MTANTPTTDERRTATGSLRQMDSTVGAPFIKTPFDTTGVEHSYLTDGTRVYVRSIVINPNMDSEQVHTRIHIAPEDTPNTYTTSITGDTLVVTISEAVQVYVPLTDLPALLQALIEEATR